jgi:RND family efflux transporter MFP subunit
VRANGELALSPQKKASVNSLIGGIIRQILVFEGTNVRAGQVVATLENTESVELQKKYLVTQKEATVAEQELKRQNELAAQGAGVEKSLQQAAANYDIAQAQLTGLGKQLQQLSVDPAHVAAGNMVTQIPIKSPIAGTIDKIFVNIGSYVDIQNPLMLLSDNSQLHCDLNVFEKDINRVKDGQRVAIILTNQPETQLEATIYGINQFFENETKAITVHARLVGATLATAQNLMPGMYLTALINTGKHEVDAVPNDAIVSTDGNKYLFVLEDEMADENGKALHFRRVEVVTGASEMGYTQITPVVALPEKAKIVKSNAFYIASMLAGGEEE